MTTKYSNHNDRKSQNEKNKKVGFGNFVGFLNFSSKTTTISGISVYIFISLSTKTDQTNFASALTKTDFHQFIQFWC